MNENPLGKRIVVFIFVVIPIIIAFFINVRDAGKDEDIGKNKKITKGVITKVFYGRSPYINWKYDVDGVTYEGSALDTKDFNFEIYHPMVGDTFEVEYSSVNPANSRLIIEGMRSYR